MSVSRTALTITAVSATVILACRYIFAVDPYYLRPSQVEKVIAAARIRIQESTDVKRENVKLSDIDKQFLKTMNDALSIDEEAKQRHLAGSRAIEAVIKEDEEAKEAYTARFHIIEDAKREVKGFDDMKLSEKQWVVERYRFLEILHKELNELGESQEFMISPRAALERYSKVIQWIVLRILERDYALPTID
ncbi:MAG: hypothetical protein GWP59_04995 [Chlamydiales bacterium]|nr:hypothetical protein [Chlamydiales bacterium]